MAVALQPPAIHMAAGEVDWLLISGGESVMEGDYNYFTAWCDFPATGDRPAQRVVVCRLVVPLTVAKQINADAKRIWDRANH